MTNQNGHFGYFHVYNRGVDKRKVFNDDSDYKRFVRLLTSKNKVNGTNYVKILAFCLMDNHYHLLVEQIRQGGLAKFMHRVGTAYTMAFNKENNRSGSLFETRYKSKQIFQHGHLFHLFRYIHLNPLKFFDSQWKSGMQNAKEALAFIYSYPWSNINDLFKNRSETTHSLIEDEFLDKDNYSSFLLDWIKYGTPSDIISGSG